MIDDLDPILIDIDDIEINKVKFEYLSAAVEEFSLEQPQMTFDNIPSGFEGFLFSDPILEINIYNQIGVPSTINMELKGLDEYGNELESIVIDQSINSPDFAGSSLGLIDTTCIRIHSECIDKYSSVCGDYTCEECEENDDCESSAQSTSLSEFLQEAPNTLEVSGISTLDGNGYIYPDRYVWGDFNLEVPFSLIMGDTMIVGNMDTIFNDLNIIIKSFSKTNDADRKISYFRNCY